jgi:hypothetical protein
MWFYLALRKKIAKVADSDRPSTGDSIREWGQEGEPSGSWPTLGGSPREGARGEPRKPRILGPSDSPVSSLGFRGSSGQVAVGAAL